VTSALPDPSDPHAVAISASAIRSERGVINPCYSSTMVNKPITEATSGTINPPKPVTKANISRPQSW
jgi:hypothetical protein